MADTSYDIQLTSAKEITLAIIAKISSDAYNEDRENLVAFACDTYKKVYKAITDKPSTS